MNRCKQCGKKAVVGRQVSHSGRKSRKVFHANLHKYKGMVFCTKCLRRYKVAEVEKVGKVPKVSKVNPGKTPILQEV